MLKIKVAQMVVTVTIITLGVVAPANAHEVIIMDCGEVNGRFVVEDVSHSNIVDIAPKVGDDCAEALEPLLEAGYDIVPGGGGAIHDTKGHDEHVVYTLVNEEVEPPS